MKRIWFAIIFLAICAVLCTGEQLYVKKVYNDINTLIYQSINVNGNEQSVGGVKNIKEYWNKHNDMLFSIEDSQALNELAGAILTLDENDKNIKEKLSQIKTMNEIFYKNQKVTIANIL